MTLNDLIQHYCISVETEDRVPAGPYTVYRGLTLYAYSIERHIPDGFVERKDWADGGLRRVWLSRDDLSVITYCEGSVIVVVCPDWLTFGQEVARQEWFYKEN